jgi:hypothetical protein
MQPGLPSNFFTNLATFVAPIAGCKAGTDGPGDFIIMSFGELNSKEEADNSGTSLYCMSNEGDGDMMGLPVNKELDAEAWPSVLSYHKQARSATSAGDEIDT